MLDETTDARGIALSFVWMSVGRYHVLLPHDIATTVPPEGFVKIVVELGVDVARSQAMHCLQMYIYVYIYIYIYIYVYNHMMREDLVRCVFYNNYFSKVGL